MRQIPLRERRREEGEKTGVEEGEKTGVEGERKRKMDYDEGTLLHL